jgi:hypothetical protein
MTYLMTAGSLENAWHAVDDCKEMTTYVPHFAECENTIPPNPPPSERHDGLTLKYLRLSKNVVKFSFVTVTMYQDVWINKPHIYLWRQNHGDMKFNEGYWRFIPVKPKLIVMAYQTLTDVGRMVPDFIQKALTEKDLPNNVRVTRKHIEEVLERDSSRYQA